MLLGLGPEEDSERAAAQDDSEEVEETGVEPPGYLTILLTLGGDLGLVAGDDGGDRLVNVGVAESVLFHKVSSEVVKLIESKIIPWSNNDFAVHGHNGNILGNGRQVGIVRLINPSVIDKLPPLPICDSPVTIGPPRSIAVPPPMFIVVAFYLNSMDGGSFPHICHIPYGLIHSFLRFEVSRLSDLAAATAAVVDATADQEDEGENSGSDEEFIVVVSVAPELDHEPVEEPDPEAGVEVEDEHVALGDGGAAPIEESVPDPGVDEDERALDHQDNPPEISQAVQQ